MRIWFDTEFVETGREIIPLSIGMVREDGEELYIEFALAWQPRTKELASPWVLENVYPHLTSPEMSTTTVEARRQILVWAGDEPQFWGYYADYDWVLLCQLFGTMMDLPVHWPRYCRDLKQEADRLRIRLPQQDVQSSHHALVDAKWLKFAHEWIEADLIDRAEREAQAQADLQRVERARRIIDLSGTTINLQGLTITVQENP